MSDDQPIEVRDLRKRPFFWADNVIIDHYAAIIGPYATLVYLALSRHADQSTRESHPSHEFLAKKLQISRATVKRAIATLIEHRLVQRKYRTSKSGDPDTNIYILLEPWGRVSQNPPDDSGIIDETVTSAEVGSDRTEVGSYRTEGRVPQNRGVGSVGATNKNQFKQDSCNKETDATPQPSADADDIPPDSPSAKTKTPKAQQPGTLDAELIRIITAMKVQAFHCLADQTHYNEVFWDAQIVCYRERGCRDFSALIRDVDAHYAAHPEAWPREAKAARARMKVGLGIAFDKLQQRSRRYG